MPVNKVYTSLKNYELGSSKIVNLIRGVEGYTSFQTPNEVLERAIKELKGEEVTDDISNLPKVKAGTYLEPAILNLFSHDLKEICDEQQATFKIDVPDQGYFFKVKGGKLGSSIDAKIKFSKTISLLDHNNVEHKLSGVGNIEIKNFSGAATDPVPLYQEFQQQSQLLTTASNFSLLVRLVKGWDLQWFVYFPDKKIQQLLIDAATDFWFRVDGIMNGKDYWYPPENTKEASKLIKGNGVLNAFSMDGNNELQKLVDDFHSANVAIKASQEIKDLSSKRMKEIMGEHEVVKCNDVEIRHTTMEKARTKVIKLDGPPLKYRRFSVKHSVQR